MNLAPLTEEKAKDGLVLLVDKPLHWTSFQAVAKLRYTLQRGLHLKKLKVGHAGTLDPLATGLLIICVGKKTKEIDQFMGLEKEYIATLNLGATTPSYDMETEVDATFATAHITRDLLDSVLPQFTGAIEQLPPIFSAIKQGGVRAYEKARAGEDVRMKARTVHIHELEVLTFSPTQIELRILCSKGTYIRSLAHDLGKALDSGAYLSALRRTKIGTYSMEDAKEPEQWADALRAAMAES